MAKIENLLKGGDLRSIGKANTVVSSIPTQMDFDELVECLYNDDRKVVMRSADAIEKISLNKPEYLSKHRSEIIEFCKKANNIEFKWHLALLVSRLDLSGKESITVWKILVNWVYDQYESRIVRVNALQGLYNLLLSHPMFKPEFIRITNQLEQENIPSIRARIKKLRKEIGHRK